MFFPQLVICNFVVSIREASTPLGVYLETCTGFRYANYGWLRNEVVPVTVLKWVALAPYDVLNLLTVGTKVGTHVCLCTVVAAEQDFVLQSIVFAKAELHAGMNRQRLFNVAYV